MNEEESLNYNQMRVNRAADEAAAPAPPEVQQSVLIAGQLAGMSFDLDADALERWLNTNPKGFKYEKWCRAAIAYKRAISLPPNEKAKR